MSGYFCVIQFHIVNYKQMQLLQYGRDISPYGKL